MTTRGSGMTMTEQHDTHTRVCFLSRRTRKQYNVNIYYIILYMCVCVRVFQIFPRTSGLTVEGIRERKGHCNALQYVYVYTVYYRKGFTFLPSTSFIVVHHILEPSPPLPVGNTRSLAATSLSPDV